MNATSSETFGFEIAVILATKDRSTELANRALRSVADQTRHPNYLVVVDDSDRRFRPANRRIVATLDLPSTRVSYRQNDRTAGASGAWNVALDVLNRTVDDPTRVFVAVLDDDDRWVPTYLDRCAQRACSDALDMVAADILRLEELGAAPLLNPAPDELRATDFLVGNPGVQGSNLFVRLSVLLAAGLFDEALKSTTDRDLCIRIADLGGVRYGRLADPLVEHFADSDRNRLSTPGSPSKKHGLTAFWRKYADRMSLPQKSAFRERARVLFDWSEDAVPSPVVSPGAPPAIALPPPVPVPLVVGIIADPARPAELMELVRGLLRLQSELGGLDVVILENGGRGSNEHALDNASLALRDAGAACYLVPLERQATDASAGLFGEPFERGPGRATIAVARTMLQTYLWVVAKSRTDAVVWIVDGDCRFDNLVWDGEAVVERPMDVAGVLARLSGDRIDIAIGIVTDAPPVPFASCIRTQLVDAYHNLEVMAATPPHAPWPDRQVANMQTRAHYEDYYYDLSRRETDHLETPFWYAPAARGSVRDAFEEMVSRLPRILAGEEVFRPIVVDGRVDPLSLIQPSIHRGGNTFVFDVDALREFPNVAPSVDGTETRRSDMIWSLLNRYVAHRTVVRLPLAVRQDRREQPVDGLDMDKLARDIQGYALYSALEDVLLEQGEAARWGSAEAVSGLDEVSAEQLEARMQKYLRERLAAFSLSFHRAAGLARLLGRYVGEIPGTAPWWLAEPDCGQSVAALRELVTRLRSEYDLSRLRGFQQNVFAAGAGVAQRFLDQLRADLQARAKGDAPVRDVESWIQDERVVNAEHQVKREFGVERLRLLGCGAEAVVLTDEHTVFKYFDRCNTQGWQSKFEFLRGQNGRWDGNPGLYPLHDVRSCGSSAVLTYDYEPSVPYEGGHGEGLVRLLQSCREVGIVCTNIHPDNLVVTATGLKLVDYGADIEPFCDEAFEHMARRAFLSYRFPARPDLRDLMRQALSDFSLPELDGFDRFREALEPASKEQLLDARLAAALGPGADKTVLDYGCGKGKLAATLSASGWRVTAYDPAPGYEPTWRRCAGFEHGGRALLEELRRGHVVFDAVVCSLVLCMLDDAELRQVLADLRRFSKPGGLLLAAVCNPRFVRGTTQLQQRLAVDGKAADDVFELEKRVFSTNARVVDVHRPAQKYIELFAEHGFVVEAIAETPGVDLETFQWTSDFMFFHLLRPNAKEATHHACSSRVFSKTRYRCGHRLRARRLRRRG